METTYRNIIRTVVENGRIETYEDVEIEVEVAYECSKQGLTAEQTAECVALALRTIQR